MKRLLIKLFCGFVCVAMISCNRKPAEMDRQSFVVHGTLANASPGPVVLSLMQDGTPEHDSSAVDKNGRFEIQGNSTQPEVVRLSLSKESRLIFVLDASDITIEADAEDLAGTARFSGSVESSLLQSLTLALAGNSKAQTALERQFALAQMQDKTDSLIYYQEQFLRLQTANTRLIKKFIREHPRSFAATYAAVMMLDDEAEGAFLDSMVVVFNKTMPQSSYVKELNEWAKDRVSIAEGSVAPDLILPRPDGTELALSSFRGKYVLIDFWASWCGPCRKENPEVVALYNRYKDRGFEVYGVSLDESKEQWVNAITKDALPWPQVSDLKGGSSPAASLYKVTTIPSTFLLDKEGKIISVDVRGAALAGQLRDLLGE